MASFYSAKWGKLKRPNDVAMLNLISTPNSGNITNGIVMTVDEADLKKLIQREVDYDLVPVTVVLWEDAFKPKDDKKDDKNEPKYFIAYAFLAPLEPRGGRDIVTECINPVKNYALMVKEAAANYGKDYLKLWMETTFLADKNTPFHVWEESPTIDMWNSPACLERAGN